MNLVVHIAYIESRFDETAVSRTGDYGLMQINWASHRKAIRQAGRTRTALLDPEFNVEYGCRLLSYCSNNSKSLYGIVRQYSPWRPSYYARKLQRLMSQSDI